MKRCNDCALSKTLSHFGKVRVGTKFRQRAICKDCHNAQSKNRYFAQTEEQKNKQKDRTLKRLYGITLDQYNQLFKKQKGVCLGCERHQSELRVSLSVDHCHRSGRVRGLLCGDCNLAIGNVKENPNTLKRLVGYLSA